MTKFGIVSALRTPFLQVYNGSFIVAQNTAWDATAASAVRINTADQAVGAFALTPSVADTALVLTLVPGAYVAQVTATGNASGTALVEVYQLP